MTIGNNCQVIPGIANIYIDGRYVGQSELGEELNNSERYLLSLGQDKDVSAERKLSRGFTKKKFVGNNKIEIRRWEVNVLNKKNELIKLLLEDQYPISKVSDIKVDLKNTSEAIVDKEFEV